MESTFGGIVSTATVLVLALLLDAALGEPQWLWSRIPHPAVLMGRVVGWLDRYLNNGPAQRLKGAFSVLLLSGTALLLGYLLSLLGPFVEMICAAILLAQRSLVQHVRTVSVDLRHSLTEARRSVSMIVSRDCREMTESQIARSAIESASENLSDGVVAPAFWFLIAGLPGIFLYKIINTADSMIGYQNEWYGEFGWAAARLDDVLNLIPARLTGSLIAATTGKAGSWGDISTDARQHRSPNAGWPEAAMARALDLALAGPRSYDGRIQQLAWVNGNARKDIGADDIDAAISVLWRVWAVLLASTIAIACLSALPLF